MTEERIISCQFNEPGKTKGEIVLVRLDLSRGYEVRVNLLIRGECLLQTFTAHGYAFANDLFGEAVTNAVKAINP